MGGGGGVLVRREGGRGGVLVRRQLRRGQGGVGVG